MNISKLKVIIGVICLNVIPIFSCAQKKVDGKLNISGIYPHLAFYNNEAECGTGAVVPWADRLWAVTYAPHSPYGSSDKLYEITPELELITHHESIGGTPANRLIHKESNQLFIGPYIIDNKRNIRQLSYKTAPGRYTGSARHLTSPESKIYIATMEEGLYEVDVNTLETNALYSDDNVSRKPADFPDLENNLAALQGWHGKGLYSGQDVLVYSNNGEYGKAALERFDAKSGSLYEWDGKVWKLIRRNQFTEITGPGGITGNPNPKTDPIWTIGFDYKSILLGLRQNGKWHFFRLPKVSYSYDGAHGWNTEWPRIRNIGSDRNPDFLMTMHGMFWKFPETFSFTNTAGIRPRSAYLKVIGDFTSWNNKLVFGCDDSAQNEFLNTRSAKGGISGPGQSCSNLWFVPTNDLDAFGTNNASGYVWLREKAEADIPSESFLFAGWKNRSAWIKNDGDQSVNYVFEVDKNGNDQWTELMRVSVLANSSRHIAFKNAHRGEWIRVKTDKNTRASVGFVYTSSEKRTVRPDHIFEGIATIGTQNVQKGLLYSLGNDKKALGVLAANSDSEVGYYEIDQFMNFSFKPKDSTADFIRNNLAIPKQSVQVDTGSVLITDDSGRRWRLPLGDDKYTEAIKNNELRICREVATERDLFNCHGTFYELPAENADGYAKIRPIASHDLLINDYASYRGLFIISGIDPTIRTNNPHIFKSDDNKAAVWAGTIDDLWKLGKPVGKGGPWVKTYAKAGIFSDPYMFGFYDKRKLKLSHNDETDVVFTVEIDPSGDNEWMHYKTFVVGSGITLTHEFPSSVSGRWIRFSVNKDVVSTAWLDYN